MADLSPTPEKGKSMQGNLTTPKVDPHSEYSLKGTFICVLMLGAFIVLSWLGVFELFLSRL